jgi:histidine kinase/DNA gyrase B/HSP90-like ATPase
VDLTGLVPRLARRPTGPAVDGLVALGLAVSNLALLGAGGDLRGAGDLAEAGAAVLICGCVAICRARPRLAAAGAGAGQRLAGTDPALAAEAFDAIGELASQAGAEIGRLVELLDTGDPADDPDGVRLIGALAARAAAAGLAVTCRVTDAAAGLAAPASDAAYRVVQESLTNALKHAPGAAVEIEVAGVPGAVEIRVRNGPAAGRGAELERSGGGRGLAGMRERVAACGGQVTAGPISAGPAGPATDGGWLVRAWLPR